ncbi:MAG: winged helix-turn-helix transcriptional regulator [Moorea sp. SIO2B7]|nr:winged helix-turn-helix transcriptional regulator [Moorena sp. SIO2B7]
MGTSPFRSNQCEATYDDTPLQLTPTEYALLELFLRNSDRVLSRRNILDNLGEFGEQPGEEAVKVHLRGLRAKLKAVGAPANFIETIYGIGYRLNPSV